jgi:diguanylate cyclase (GGDEF)-like protein/PAS domain S-box-containing protein
VDPPPVAPPPVAATPARAAGVRLGGWGKLLAWAALAAGLLATLALWMQSRQGVQERAQFMLSQRLELIQARVKERASAYAAVLQGAAGLFAASPEVSRLEWERFATSLGLRERYPAVQALAYVHRVAPEDVALHERAVRASGQPGYRVRPVAARRELTPVVLLEPASAANLALLGFDLSADAGLRRTLELAGERGKVTASGKAPLPVEPSVQGAVVILCLPVYRTGGGASGGGAGNPALGYVVALLRVDSVMRRILGQEGNDVGIEVYDGARVDPAALLFREGMEAGAGPALEGTVQLENTVWTVQVAPRAEFAAALGSTQSRAVLVAGLAVSLLLFLSLHALASGQVRARLLVLRMGDALRARERRFAELTRHAPVGVYIAGARGDYVFVNERWCELSGLGEDAARGQGWLRTLHPDDRDKVLAGWAAATQAGRPFEHEFRMRHVDGSERYVVSSAVPERDERGEVLAYIGTCMDITARRTAELALTRANEALEERVRSRTAELEDANARLSREIDERRRAERERSVILQRQIALLNGIPELAWMKDRDLRIVAVNERLVDWLHTSRDALIGKTDFDVAAPELAERHRQEDLEVIRTGRSLRLDEQGRYGTDRWFEVVKTPVLDDDGHVVGVTGIARDITERKRTEDALRESNARLQVLVDELERRGLARAALNELGSVLGVCNTLEEGLRALARDVAALFPGSAGVLYWLYQQPAEGSVVAAFGPEAHCAPTVRPHECWALRRGKPHACNPGNDALLCEHLRGAPPAPYTCAPLLVRGQLLGLLYCELPGASGLPDAALATEQLAAWRQWTASVAEYLALALSNLILRETLETQARHDPLTDLYNRRYMEEALERELRRAERSKRPMGVMMLDLDFFKRYNDTLGHEAGDRLLVALANLLRTQVRAGDVVCRYGGEEFLIILPETPAELVMQRAEQLRRMVTDQLRDPSDGRVGPVTLSLGVAVYPVHGTTSADLVRAADAALYRAKSRGRNRVEIAEESGRAESG